MNDKLCPFCGHKVPEAQCDYVYCLNTQCPNYGKDMSWTVLIDPVVKIHKPRPVHLIRKSKYKPTLKH